MTSEWNALAALLMRATFCPAELLAEVVSSSSSAGHHHPLSTTHLASVDAEITRPPILSPEEPQCARIIGCMHDLDLNAPRRMSSGLSSVPAHAFALPLLSSPLGPPRLPDDLLAYIISFCPMPTLASWSLVSFRCLELAGRVLYGKVEIRRHGGYDRLFYDRVSRSKRYRGSGNNGGDKLCEGWADRALWEVRRDQRKTGRAHATRSVLFCI